MNPHDGLLEKWSREKHHQKHCFIKDGVVDTVRWRCADPKVLFLLKEAYDDNGRSSWDLRRYLRKEPSALNNPTWRNAAYWCYAIHHIKRGRLPGLPFLPERKAEYDHAVELLLSSAVVNIKKSKGQHRSSNIDIEGYARRDRELIQKQINLIKPDVVICGNTWQFVEAWFPNRKQLWDGVYRVEQRLFVNYWHPSARGSDELKYYALAGQLHFSDALAHRCHCSGSVESIAPIALRSGPRSPRCGLNQG